MSHEPQSVRAARLKVVDYMRAQAAKGEYPWAWESPAWDAYMDELNRHYARPQQEVGSQSQ